LVTEMPMRPNSIVIHYQQASLLTLGTTLLKL
jgi:hypothetical protein